MARFEMVGETLHVYPDGAESNIGVFDGVDSIHFHDGCRLWDTVYEGIEATHITFDEVRGTPSYMCFPCATDVSWSIYNYIFEFSELILPHYNHGSIQPVLDHDVTVRIIGDTVTRRDFTLRKGMKKFIVNNIMEMYAYNFSVYTTVANAYQYTILPLDWVDTYFVATDMRGKNDMAKQFVKRRIARSIKKYFNEADDLLVIRLINEGLLTKPTMTALLDMANDSGRIDVVAAILDKVGGGGRKRFAI